MHSGIRRTFREVGPNTERFRYCVEQGAAFTSEELHSELLESFHNFSPNGERFRYCVEQGAAFASEELHSELLESFRKDGPKTERFRYCVEQGAAFTSEELHSELLESFHNFSPNGERFRYCVEQGAAFTSEELHSELLESFRKGGPNTERFRYCVEQVARSASAMRLAVLLDSARTCGPCSPLVRALLPAFDNGKVALLVQYLCLVTEEGKSWESLFTDIKRRSPVFIIERPGRLPVVSSQAFFQAQSAYFELRLSDHTSWSKRCVNIVNFPVNDLDLKAAVEHTMEIGQSVPIIALEDGFQDATIGLLLKFCQSLSVDWELISDQDDEWLECMMDVLKAASVYGIFLLVNIVQGRIISELKAVEVDQKVIDYVKEDAPVDAHMLKKWCSEHQDHAED